MTAQGFLKRGLLAVGIVVALSGIPELAAAAQEIPAPSSQPSATDQAALGQNANRTDSPANTVPDSPGTVRMQSSQNNPPSSDAPAAAGNQTNSAPGASTQSAPGKPLGTAAAEPVTPTGVAASQPAGAAIAPAKQRRTRSLLIKIGAIVGGGVALGTIFALSNATSSKPPGAH